MDDDTAKSSCHQKKESAMSLDENNQGKFPLSDLIHQVKLDLAEAMKRHEAGQSGPEFVVESVELEVNFVIEEMQKAEGGAKAALFAIGFKAKGEKTYKTEQVHKITLQLTAREKPSAEKETIAAISAGLIGKKWGGIGGPTLPGRKIRVSPFKTVIDGYSVDEIPWKEFNAKLKSTGYYAVPCDLLPENWLEK
jgi:hypothetical protein